MPTSGSWFAYLTAVRTWLAASSDLRTWCGASDAADALNYLYLFAAAPAPTQLKYGILSFAKPLEANRDTVGQGDGAFRILRSVRLDVFHWLAAGAPHSEADATEFGNFLGLLWSYALDNSWGTIHLARIAQEFDARAAIPGDWHIQEATDAGRAGYKWTYIFDEDR